MLYPKRALESVPLWRAKDLLLKSLQFLPENKTNKKTGWLVWVCFFFWHLLLKPWITLCKRDTFTAQDSEVARSQLISFVYNCPALIFLHTYHGNLWNNKSPQTSWKSNYKHKKISCWVLFLSAKTSQIKFLVGLVFFRLEIHPL